MSLYIRYLHMQVWKEVYVGRSTPQYPSQSFKLQRSQWGASLLLQRASGGSYLHQGDQILGQIGAICE